jgi:predicted small lipoprotein YifL
MRKTSATKWIAVLLLLAHLFSLTACAKKQPAPTETNVPTESVMPTETEAQTAEFIEGISVFTDAALSPVERQDTENGIILTSANAAGESAQIRLDK